MSNTKGTSVITPPSGGGAQSGLGETFSPDLFTGTGNFSVPIAVPPGRNGFQPELTLGYSTGNGNGVFGMGWALGLPGVTRKTSKGIPVYDDKTDVFILSGAEDLVEVKNEQWTIGNGQLTVYATQYRPRTEGLFARITHFKKSNGDDYWEVRSKDGLISYYGMPDSNGNDPCVIANPEDRKAIYGWCLSKTVDVYGNEIIYTYDRELVIGTPHTYDQLYLSSIQYAQYYENNVKKYLCEVKFNYEERTDPFSTYRQGFEMRTTKRCTSIETFTHTTESIAVKTMHFNYQENLPLNGASLLESIEVEGHLTVGTETESEWMPPLTFDYATFEPSRRGLKDITGPIPAVSVSNPGYELVDVTGNGLPDLLQLNGVSRYWTNKGNGVFSSPKMLDISPSVQLGSSGVRMIDANGDGRTDLMVNNGIQAGYFPGKFGSVWNASGFRPYSKIPSFNFADPEVQFIDLDGDGITDVLRNGAKFECYFNNPEKGFDKVRVRNKTFADFSFADPRIRFADMTGDGLQDIVIISSGRVQYWPNLGYGNFGAKVNMTNSPSFPEQYNPAQVLLGDLDGDGLADIAFVENNSVTLYVNQSGNGFSAGTKVTGTPPVQNPNDLRIIDAMGSGQAGILWSLQSTLGIAGKLFFLDFTAGNKPYVLEEMNNNMGSLTRVEYGSSIDHYLRDEPNPATRWITQLPFPVQVVNKVEVLDLLSGGKLTTEYNYHNGYWDGVEREFRGFAQVDSFDTETFERFNEKLEEENEKLKVNSEKLLVDNLYNATEYYSPPVMTKSWFYPGPVGDSYTQWIDPDFSSQYWQGDAPVFTRPAEMTQLLNSLPRRAQRDALRTLRGTLLRSEVYALDNSPLQDRPYTVTENQMGLRLEFEGSEKIKDKNEKLKEENEKFFTFHSSLFIFFPFNVASRTTQYERGTDPMHSFSFTKDYDAYGQAIGQLSVGLPRGANPLSGGNGNYLGTYSISDYIYKDIPNGQYMVNRVKRSISYDATQPANSTTVFAYRDTIFSSHLLPAIACVLNFYDGNAFVGLPFGQIGNYGNLIRSETLVITDDIITDAYGANTPECFKATPDWSSTNGYPAAFEGLLQNGDVRLGYKDYTNPSFTDYVQGWYAESGRMKYDFQDITVINPVGLVLETKDVFDTRSTIEYDSYSLLPISAKQYLNATDFLETKAEYDYRVLQPYKITDANDNITVFDFSPLGLLTATALIGKGTQGDYKSATGTFYERYAPSKQMEYDFFAFKDEGNPVWVKTIQREQHYQQNPTSETIVKVEYSDGFGRLLQTRAQAEDVIFGNETFGSSGLSPDQNLPNAPATGTERSTSDPLNVVVSGWKIYNNKGKVVEQYEPFFDTGFDYTLPQLSTTGGIIAPQVGVKIKMYYDPLGRVIRTVNPDNSEQRVIYGIPDALDTPDSYTPTSWEQYSYDANDLAPLTNPNSNVPQSNWYTPKSSLMDALGRTLQTTEHKAHYNTIGAVYEDVVMKYSYDIRGNLLEVKDPYERNVFEHKYDLRPVQKDEQGKAQPLPPLWTKHIDSGISTVVFDATEKPIESEDAKGAETLGAFDVLHRPSHIWAKDKTGETITLRQFLQYGDSAGLPNPENENLKGQIYKHYDEAGLLETPEYDFKNNLLEKKREVISDSDLLAVFNGPPVNWNVNPYIVDWDNPPTLEGNYVTTMEFDALNRITKMIYPEDVETERKELLPAYSRSGALESVKMDGNDYVNHIAYNPKGQRLLIAFGNNVMTRYLYDNRTFHLTRQRTEKYTESNWVYTPDGSVKQDTAYNYDLVGNILNSSEKNVSACGVGGTGSLSRNFDYDPLYRLLTANGRENTPAITPIWDDSYRSSDDSTTTAYTQNYQYDKLGNIQKLQHIGNNNFTRNFNYINSNNQLQSLDIGATNYAYSYDACGNQLTESTSRHFVWDTVNRLRSFFVQVGTSEPTQYAQYLYDSKGVRVKKIVRAQGGSYTSTTYINAVFEYKTDGTDEQNLLHVVDNSSRIALIRLGFNFGDTTPAIKYVIENFVRSSIVLLETNAASINMQEYYPFGETSFGSYAKKRYQYAGKERDSESGLYYYGARYYSAWTCRFISVDKLAADYMQLTPYQNAGNNPVNDYDIDGNQGEKTPTTVEINYPEGSITAKKNEWGQYAINRSQLDAIGKFGTNWHDDREPSSATINLQPGGQLDVFCSDCNHGNYSYVTLHIPKQASVDKDTTNMAFTSTETSNSQAPPTAPNQSNTPITGIPVPPTGQVNIGNNVIPPGGNLWIGLNAQFSGGTANLTNQTQIQGAINNIANALKANPKNTFTIFGSVLMRAADNWDSPVPANPSLSNRQLATQRTQAIANLLIKQGVDPSQINQRIGVKTAQRVNGNFQNNAPAQNQGTP